MGGRTILIVGETGTGKSSVTNMLTGGENAAVSSKARGCTFESQGYPTPQGDMVYDTVGLNESDNGTVSPKKAIAELIKLLKSLEGGINLFILVIRMGKITEHTQRNYDLFVKGICNQKVPVVLVVTNCETCRNLGDWVDENKATLQEIGDFDAIIPACASKWTDRFHPALKQVMDEAYLETKQRMENLLKEDKYEKTWTFGTWRNWLKSVFGTVWNIIAKAFKWPQISLWDGLKKALMEAFGYDETYATAVANDVAHEVHGW